MYKKIILVLVFILVFVLTLFLYKSSDKNNTIDANDLNIYIFNGGKADAILISKNNKHILIDTGEKSLSDDITNYFNQNNIKELEYLIITHFDKDHVGSASTVINNFIVHNVLQTNTDKDSEYYSYYLNALKIKNMEAITIENDYSFIMEDVNFNVNGPNKIYDSNTSNNSSLIVSLKYINNSFLFMGDSENARIKDYLALDNNTYDFIKIPHHGIYKKRLDDLFESTKASYACMTCSIGEGCEENTLDLLNQYNINYYMTKDGDVSIVSDGNSITINQ